MTLQEFLLFFLKNASPSVVLAFIAWYYFYKERPRQLEREEKRELDRDKLLADRQLECDRQHSDRMKEMIDLLRQRDKESVDREATLRREHAEAWEIHRMQTKEERELDREMFRGMIKEISRGLEALKLGQDRNYALSLVIGKSMGNSKRDLIRETEDMTQQPVDEKFKTQHPDT